MRAYLLGYNHGKDDGYFSTLIERGECEKSYNESLDVEYTTINTILDIIDEVQDRKHEKMSAEEALVRVRWKVKALKGDT